MQPDTLLLLLLSFDAPLAVIDAFLMGRALVPVERRCFTVYKRYSSQIHSRVTAKYKWSVMGRWRTRYLEINYNVCVIYFENL